MYPRTDYEMSEEQLEEIMAACKPVPMILVGGLGGPMPSSPQENANRAWAKLGKDMGFDHMTVRPITGKDTQFFTAVPSETEQQRVDRVVKEAEEKRLAEIETVKAEIADRKRRLEELGRGDDDESLGL